ncbi:hypothetical protein [Streptomyces sp. NPDC088719]|uniref:hypothetical protein n=1 Tax=Streptomyces sp. NPDC088719 TaxID=3365872 RepID=UPI00382D7434
MLQVFAVISTIVVLCAGCSWSFLQHTLDKQKAEQEKQQRQAQRYGPPTHSPGPAKGP